jgi:hypothetical protein
MLSLACWYSGQPTGNAWFQKKLPRLKQIANKNLLEAIDPKTHLVLTFNSTKGRFTAPTVNGTYGSGHAADTERKALYQRVSQMMDNCEAYRGLKDFASRLGMLGDPDSARYAAAAAEIASGIADLFDPVTKSFRVSTISARRVPGEKIPFYPDRLVQVAPQVFGVDLGAQTESMYDDAWKYLNAGGDAWWTGQIADKSTGGAPFMIVGFAAALRGERTLAPQQLTFFENALRDSKTPPEFGNIGEIAFALRIQQVQRRGL